MPLNLLATSWLILVGCCDEPLPTPPLPSTAAQAPALPQPAPLQPQVRLIHRSMHAQAAGTPSSTVEGQPMAPQAPAPQAPEAPQDFGQALRKHLNESGSDFNEREFEQVLAALEDIRAEIGAAPLWASPQQASPDALPQYPPQPAQSPDSRTAPNPWAHVPPPQHAHAYPAVAHHPEGHAKRALRDAARLLDNAAADLEEQENFGEADRLRSQANELRQAARHHHHPVPAMYTPHPQQSMVPPALPR